MRFAVLEPLTTSMDSLNFDRRRTTVLKSFACVGLLTLFTACHKQVAAVHPAPVTPAPVSEAKTAPPEESKPVVVTVPNRTSDATPTAETKATIQSLLDRIQDIYFDYDKHVLRADAESTLQADATTLREILKQYPGYKLTVQGFCDERGSDEYNLALGDARARRAQEFLETLGLPAAQLRTVSYGKEKPVCTDHDESCWQKNRRAHITQDQSS
jgi:peptidoglycan-associated lipoprotein